MSQALTRYQQATLVDTNAKSGPINSAAGATKAGLVILLLFFGGFGGWAVSAPLNAAIVGEAVVKVEGNRKSVQHLDGGIVKELRVKEGDRVKQGEVLVVLDDTQSRAEYDILSQQHVLLKATEARLMAELNDADMIEFPPELLERTGEPSVDIALRSQEKEFESRKLALRGEEILAQRISQLRERITGNDAQVKAYREQYRSVMDETSYLSELFRKGLVTKPRLLQLERTATGLEGEIATRTADTAAARQTMEEYTRQIAQLRKTQTAEVTRSLSEVQSKLLEVVPRIHNAKMTLTRVEVRSPYAGEVVDLSVFSVGGVIGRGEKILDVVPDETALVVEARIRVEDISDLHPGMGAEVHFTSYKQRTIPLIHGEVTKILRTA